MMKRSSILSLGLPVLLSLLSCVQSLDHQYWMEELLAAHKRVNSAERRGLASATSQETCARVLAESEIIASNGQKRVICQCNDNDSGTVLSCVDACNYCSADDEVCGLETFGVAFNDLGGVTGLTIGFRYIKGSSEEIFMDFTGCSSADGGDILCTTCTVSVDDDVCNSCTLVNCPDGTQTPTFNCGNVEPESIYATCDPGLTAPSDSVFYYLTTTSGDFDTCFLGDRAIFPTATPVLSPAPTYINRTDCQLSLGVGQCAPLLANTQPMEGCDCYNYCDGVFSGCCELGEACDLVCGGNQNFVAGCRFDGMYPIDTGAACFITVEGGSRQRFEQGESFGAVVTNDCGNTDDFPCFCDTITEQDSIRCPYCPFDTENGGTICAKDGDTIEFVAADGVEQRCTCDYLGDNIVQAVCEPINVVVPETCQLQRNTIECTDLTEEISPIPGCDCYNFCDGVYSGCCKYGEFCEAFCTTEDLIVAGCEVDPNKPPVAPVPTTAPVAAPRMCMVSSNTQNCADLTANQEPLENCDCYNYCGSEYVGCCEIGRENECTVSCSGLTNGDVLTAGCLLPEGPTVPTAAPPTAAPVPLPSAAPVPGPTAAPVPLPSAAPVPGPTAAPVPGTTAAPVPGTTAAPVPGTTAAPVPGTTAAPIIVAPVPTSAPVAAPRVCLVSANTQNCAALTANQEPVENCDCYNYCGSVYAGCCEIGRENECTVSCSSLGFGEVLTSGCLLPEGPTVPTAAPPTAAPVPLPSAAPVPLTSACKAYYQPCEADTDCCSDRCFSGVCRTNAVAAVKQAVKLSSVGTSRGGAAGGNTFRPGVTRRVLTAAELSRPVKGGRRLKGNFNNV